MKLSIVIPVYNSEKTLAPLVARLQACLDGHDFEIVLVNDGSRDRSEAVCFALTEQYANVQFIGLRRNFGEFNAVLCGLNYVRGQYAVIIDDDFQNPPEAILTLVNAADAEGYDVVYSRYARKQHAWFRNAGSRLLNKLATYLIDKPEELYLSSFKLIRYEVVQEIIRYKGPYPYIDGLIFRATRHVGSVEVPHHPRQEGQSNYTLKKLVSLFLNVLIGYSVWPLRVFTLVGVGLFLVSALVGMGLLIGGLADWFPVQGWYIVTWAVFLLAGLQLLFLGVVSEYLGKLFMQQSGLPPYVVKHEVVRQSSVGSPQ
ncbi:glycosyltransferase family 2 protein [Nibrella saemangeumensis]|uniref:Glycosyltransferase family 2 protein n=1 Tax=Nibrella saemangeumensis TaxID=1084526 RepID=A0ABP8N919_9BACT